MNVGDWVHGPKGNFEAFSAMMDRVRSRCADRCECIGECGGGHADMGSSPGRCRAIHGKARPGLTPVVRGTPRSVVVYHHLCGVTGCADALHVKAMCEPCRAGQQRRTGDG